MDWKQPFLKIWFSLEGKGNALGVAHLSDVLAAKRKYAGVNAMEQRVQRKGDRRGEGRGERRRKRDT